jgi:hypothetical protein
MADKSPRYRLVIFEAVEDIPAVRDLFCTATGVHPTDAIQWLSRAPGTWPQPLDDFCVRKVLDGLFQAGIAAEAWRTDQFPDLNPPRTIHRAACLSDGFRVEGFRGEPTHWAPWDRVELICAGRIDGSDEYRSVHSPRWPGVVVAGIRAMALMKPQPGNRLGRAVRIPRDPVGEVIVVRRDPRVAFRATESRMNYGYLGKRRSQSASENFPIFVADLCARAESAYITGSTRSLLKHDDTESHVFADSQALLDYATHRLLWSWYRRDRDAQARTIRPDESGARETEPDADSDRS